MPLEKEFYTQSTVTVAKNLLGKVLFKGSTAIVIVETEAYLYKNDPGCHAANGVTKRNEAMFERGGVGYVYFIYGNYYCFNVVTGNKGEGEAVLIRAGIPILGVNLMRKRRGKDNIKDLCSGPGKLCIAMDINRNDNYVDLTKGGIAIYEIDEFKKFINNAGNAPEEGTYKYINNLQTFFIHTTTRVGLKKGAGLPLRFYIKDNPFISRR